MKNSHTNLNGMMNVKYAILLVNYIPLLLVNQICIPFPVAFADLQSAKLKCIFS